MEPTGPPRVAFVVVTKGLDYPTAEERRPAGARYTRDAIRGMLQFMGCKPRHAYKAAQLVFQKLELFASEGSKFSYGSRQLWDVGAHDEGSVYVAMPRSEFYELVCSTLTEYNYKYVPSSDEIKAACSLRERRRHIIVLLCGTSGSGKSTLASILAGRLGISTVLSTDSVRHMMRSFTTAAETPLLFASTYEAGEALRKQQALEEARRQEQQQQVGNAAVAGSLAGDGSEGQAPLGPSPPAAAAAGAHPAPAPSAHDQAIRGYKAQCELVSEQLEQLICGFEARRQSLVVEGVHLHVGLVMRLLQRHPGVVPFLVYIKSEGKHVERMAVRAKYMTLDPNKNKYVKNMRNIRWIQDYLLRKAEKHAIPCVENTNIDRSVGLIHLTLLGCLKRMMKGEQMLDAGSSSVRMLHSEYSAVAESLAGAPVGAPAAPPADRAASASASAGSQQQPQREGSGSWLQQPQSQLRKELGSPRSFNRESAPCTAAQRPSGDDPAVEAAIASAMRVNSGSHIDALLQQLQGIGLGGVALPLSSSPQQPPPRQQQAQARAGQVSCGSSPREPLPWEPASSSPEQRGGFPGLQGGEGSKTGLSRPPEAVLSGFSVSQSADRGASLTLPQDAPPAATQHAGCGGGGNHPDGSARGGSASSAAAGPFVLLSPPLSPRCNVPVPVSGDKASGALQQQQQDASDSSIPPRMSSFCGAASPSRGPMLLSGLLCLAGQQQQAQLSSLAPQGMSPLRKAPEEPPGRGPRQTQAPSKQEERAEASPPLVAGAGAGASQDGVVRVAPSSPVYGAPTCGNKACGEEAIPNASGASGGGITSSAPPNGGAVGSSIGDGGHGEPGGRPGVPAGAAAACSQRETMGGAATGTVAVGSPHTHGRNAAFLSAEQQQHIDAVLPAWVRQMGGRNCSPVGQGAGGGAGAGPALPANCPWPLSASGDSEKDIRGPQAAKWHDGSGCGGGGGFMGRDYAVAGQEHGGTDVSEADGQETSGSLPPVLLDVPTAAAAAAAAANALSRFGIDCSDEVLAAAVASAILDEQMDGVTEQAATANRQRSHHSQQCSRRSTATGSDHIATSANRKKTSGNGSFNSAAPAPLPLEHHGRPQPNPGHFQPNPEAPLAAQQGAYGCEIPTRLLVPAGCVRVPDSPGPVHPASVEPALVATGSPFETPAGGGGAAMPGISAFAGAEPWAAGAALGAPTFVRMDSRQLGGLSSPSRSGYSSGGADGASDDSGVESDGGSVRRRRSQVGALGRDVEDDSDDPDGEAYGGASPLQEYGSVYESATHDDMDEHGDDDEALPLGRSNTIIKHLASALERSRMRASASKAADQPLATAGSHMRGQVGRSPGPPPAASSGAASRGAAGRRASVRTGQRGVGTAGGSSGACGGIDAHSSSSSGNSPGVQLRQMLRGGTGGRVVMAADSAAAASSGHVHGGGHGGNVGSAQAAAGDGFERQRVAAEAGGHADVNADAQVIQGQDAGVEARAEEQGLSRVGERRAPNLPTPFASPF